MSDMISSDVPPVPELRGNVREWARELQIWLERQLRDHYEDIKQLHEVKADA